jgi:putative glutamine amidotransferase
MDRYVKYVEDAGGDARVLRPGDRVDLDQLDGLLLSGGVDVHPGHYGQAIEADLSLDAERDDFEVPLGRAALASDMPVFGICRGFQLMNVLRAGPLIQDLPDHRAGESSDSPSGQHDVRVAADSRLAELLGDGDVPVNSRHHQGLTDAELAPGLRATAWSPDGLVEAFEEPGDRFVLAVQWHPERVAECDPRCLNLASAFVEAATAYAKTRKQPALSS